mgnify:CR=1 FL=1
MEVPSDCKFTKEHEWIREEAEGLRVGITDYAQVELGDIVFVELPEVGATVTKGESFGTIESVKAVRDIYSPIDGTVLAVNEVLNDAPETVNAEPHWSGWIMLIKASDKSQLEELMSGEAYEKFISEISK